MNERPAHFIRDITIVVLSFFIAANLYQTGALNSVFASLRGFEVLTSFLTGIFFISAFTAAPATLALTELMRLYNPLFIASIAALGAVIGDLLIFSFVKDSLADDIFYCARRMGFGDLREKTESQSVKYLLPIAGAIIIASPFPDEIGLVLLGLSHMRKQNFIPFAYALNFLGILLLGLAVRNIV